MPSSDRNCTEQVDSQKQTRKDSEGLYSLAGVTAVHIYTDTETVYVCSMFNTMCMYLCTCVWCVDVCGSTHDDAQMPLAVQKH